VVPRALRRQAELNAGGNYAVALPLLAKLGSEESVAVLERILLSGSDGSSWYAAQALGMHPHPSARDALARALRSPDARARRHAVNAFVDQDGAWACEALRALCDDSDSLVREAAEAAVRRVGC
jgi:HEAT repeat protein